MKSINQILIYILYIGLFWFTPLFVINIDTFFGTLQNILSYLGLSIDASLFYLLAIIPIVSLLIYSFIRKSISKSAFVFWYILLPYIPLIVFLIYAYIHLFDHFNPIG